MTGRAVKLSGAGDGEVDYKAKAGTAWSHSYLNQKPWHPLSYPNQRRRWIAEQTHANRARRQEEVAREFAQEQEFFRQTSLFNKKEKDKVTYCFAILFAFSYLSVITKSRSVCASKDGFSFIRKTKRKYFSFIYNFFGQKLQCFWYII